MSLRVEFHELVDDDLLVAWTWYEDHEAGLGEHFLAAVHAAVERASRWPNVGGPVHQSGGAPSDPSNLGDGIVERQLPTGGFPFAIRYRVFEGRLVVMAVVHQSRRPDAVANRQPRPPTGRPTS